jgi:hypothetical protein
VPFSIERWQDTDIVVVRGSGAITARDHVELLASLRTACELQPSSRVVLDLSSVDYIPAADDVRDLARSFVEFARPNQCLMAVVARSGAQFGVARMLEILTSFDGVSAAAFTALADAVAWIEAGSAPR